jgi:hypothetical protein
VATRGRLKNKTPIYAKMAGVLAILFESIEQYNCSPQQYMTQSRQCLRHPVGISFLLQILKMYSSTLKSCMKTFTPTCFRLNSQQHLTKILKDCYNDLFIMSASKLPVKNHGKSNTANTLTLYIILHKSQSPLTPLSLQRLLATHISTNIIS